MAWLIASYRNTSEGGRTEVSVYAPDGARLGPVPMDERGKPGDLHQRARERQVGIVWQKRRGKEKRDGEDHYWVLGDGREYLVVEEDVSNSGQRAVRLLQEPVPWTEAQQLAYAAHKPTWGDSLRRIGNHLVGGKGRVR